MQNYSILSKFLKLITVQVKDENGKQHEVCSKTFLSIYCVTAERVRSLAAHKWQTDNPRGEQRGGKRLKPGYEDLKEEIKQHISRYRCVSSHYGRNKTPHKKYLPSNLNVLKMYRAFLEQYSGTLSVKYSLYYKVFVTSFNLGFGNPRTDVCSTCVKLKSTINATQEAEKKKELVTELLVHKMRAKKYYSLLKEEHDDSVLTICFDLMQNQPLPKSPVGEAYYSRQLWQFFFGVLVHHPGKQNKDDVAFYTWGEHEQGRGANSVASALTHFIEGRLATSNQQTQLIRLFSDSCIGQNKNFAVLLALHMLAAKYKVKFLHYFPVRGHSYMPPDRAFGRVEKLLRRKETILTPHEYFAAFNEVGHVFQYGDDWKVYDFKALSKIAVKTQPGFRITDAKVLEVVPESSKMTVRNFYAAAGCQHAILKRGTRLTSLVAKELLPINTVKAVKKRDVLQLLQAMGQNRVAEVMDYYRPICEKAESNVAESDDDEALIIRNEDSW